MSCAQRPSRSGWSRTSTSSSPTSSACRPSSRSASIRRSSADEMELFEPENLRLRERLVSEVGKRWTAPEVESFAKSSRRQLGRGLLRLLHQPLEAEQVELVRTDADHVTRLLGDDRLAGSERLAELGDVVLERVRGRLGRLRSPELVDEPAGRDDLVRAREQQGEERALPRAAERECPTSLDNLERSKDPELHAASPLTTLSACLLLSRASAMPQCWLGPSVSSIATKRGCPRAQTYCCRQDPTSEYVHSGPDRIRLSRLSNRGADWPGRHGRRLPRLRPAAEADRRAEAHRAGAGAR